MRITDHIHALKIPFKLPIGPGVAVERFVYAYLIYGKRIYLIDTGVAPSVEAIFSYITGTGRKPGEIAMAILTHSHPDHIGGAAAIRRATGCAIAAHGAERPWIEDVELQCRERPVPGFHSIAGASVNVDRVLEDGDVLEPEEGLRLEVLHTPGHSKGSISLLLRGEMALFSGDAVPVAGDAPIYDDAVASARSIDKLKSIEGLRWLLSAWDPPKNGDDVYLTLGEGLDFLQRIHGMVRKSPSADAGTICGHVLRELGLPEKAINPLAIRSIEANLRARERRDLLGD